MGLLECYSKNRSSFFLHVSWPDLVCCPFSRDASDTSLDDEQFRARREFLKSGLPESFKKQIAKTAASREAYTLSCSSFQKVVHVLQRPDGKTSLICPRFVCFLSLVVSFLPPLFTYNSLCHFIARFAHGE